MIRTVKPKNARAKRALEKKEAKLVEDVKQALFVPGKTSNKFLHDVMVDLSALKKPAIKRFSRKNDIRPFEDTESIEFLSEKNDSSLVVVSTNSKKRKNNLTFIRTFGYKVYDMIELQIAENAKLLSDFRKQTFNVGLKPMFSFQGAAFDSHPVYKSIKSLFLDFFRGQTSSLQDVAGLQHVISLTIQGDFQDGEPLPNLLFRVYKLKTYKSSQGGSRLPRVELEEIGPRLDFKIGRIHTPSPEMVKEAHKKAKNIEVKTPKNVEIDGMGDKTGTIHLGRQDLGQLQTRKMKGLKSKYDQIDAEVESYMENDEELLNDDSYGEDFVTASEIEPPTKKHKA
ncbi:HEL053Wp [Eremothecium sinecaudum]|uniref:Ribosome production factor 2 homolog n=1 Tax=Eremothecium sinecaudum TaxID=45286 RepID=A0A120K2E1_9SACH|nr:HEL053Wp [Eremothecium sinecaudum]AMD21227.1 HEL053Wp [Eremothecium sinecaudum]